jgi:CheY-like chemotaxis protein
MATIWVVDDDQDIRETLGQLLVEEGYQVRISGDAQEALSSLRAASHPPDLMLLDLMMPVMNGWELLAEMSEDVRLRTIPVVVITAAGVRAVPGAVGCLPKPIHLERLLAAVEQHAAPRFSP